MKWHENAETRKRIGTDIESLFVEQVRCHCGGEFTFIGDIQPGFPDFTCENCGQLVDVKNSPQAEYTGNLSVSAIPWENYPNDMLLCAYLGGQWIGEFKKHIDTNNKRPYLPTHHSKHAHLKNTEYYLINWRNFRTLTTMGFSLEIT